MSKFSILFLLFIGLSACSKKDSASGDTTDDTSVTTLMQSAATTIGEAFEADYASMVPASEMSFAESAELAPVVPFANCSSVAYGACSSSAISRNLNGCTRTTSAGNSGTFYGTITWTFSGGATCSNTPGNMAGLTTGTATRTVSNHYAESSSGYKVLVYTAAGTVAGQAMSSSDLVAYNGTSYSGGWSVGFASGSRTLSIAGVHRRGMRSSGALTFWHTIFTPTPLSITTGSGYAIASGTVTILHNRANISVANTFANVTYPSDGSCCYPTAGTITTTIGSGTPVVTTFSATCGAVTVGSVSTNLPACGGTTN